MNGQSHGFTSPLVRSEDIHKEYLGASTPVHALRGISFTVSHGEFVAIMGASGSGKSTLMSILGCLDEPTSGRYLLNDRDVGSLNSDQLAEMRNRSLGFVFQDFNLFSRMTVVENVEFPALCGSSSRTSERDARIRAIKCLNDVGLPEYIDRFPNQLSGGQQQRVAIARALVNRPQLILADEPTGNLDSKTSIEMLRILENLNDRGMTIIMVTHDVRIASVCSRKLLMQDGTLISDQLVSTRLRAVDALRCSPTGDLAQ